jgi:hypothetical protein
MCELPPATAEKHLRETLRVQADTMARRGILATTIDIEIRALECAVRAALWRQVLTPGGAA